MTNKEIPHHEWPPDPSLSQDKKFQLLIHVNRAKDLYRKCSFHFLEDILPKLKEDHLLPIEPVILRYLDEGHRAWYELSEETKVTPQNKAQHDFNKSIQKELKWYRQWKPWFEEHYPHYFTDDGE